MLWDADDHLVGVLFLNDLSILGPSRVIMREVSQRLASLLFSLESSIFLLTAVDLALRLISA